MEEDQEAGRGSETGKERGVEEEGEYEQEGCEVILDRGIFFQCLSSACELCCLLVPVVIQARNSPASVFLIILINSVSRDTGVRRMDAL